MNISFLTSGHEPFDDRIFYHMAKSLSTHKNNIEIISSRVDLREITDGIQINCFDGENLGKRDKINRFLERLSAFKPDLMICSEPLPVLAAWKYSTRHSRKIRIVYDITEWYPSKKNLSAHKKIYKWLIFIRLLLFNLWASNFADSFIFGEWYKSRPYRVLYPSKPFIFISYYPDLKYIKVCEPMLQMDLLRISYSGKISLEKGFGNFFNALKILGEIRKDLKIEVKIIGWYETDKDREECEKHLNNIRGNISVFTYKRQNLMDFLMLIKDSDIFMDLRYGDFENQHCLPIKLFYYAALGRPVIFTDLKAIRKEVAIDKFGFLVKPENSESIVRIISDYLNDKEFYHKHCRNARSLAENIYNWQKIEPLFVKFISP